MIRFRIASLIVAVTALAVAGGFAFSTHAAPATARHAVGAHFRDCANCPEMVVVPAGSFLMGSPASETGHRDSEAQHRVTFKKPFAVAKYTITWDQWMACVRDRGCDGQAVEEALRIGQDGKPLGAAYVDHGRGNRPMVGESWCDAQTYVGWLNRKTGSTGYRLLSESEFEYAQRAGTTTTFPWGDKADHNFANWGPEDDVKPLGPGFGGRDVWGMQTAPVGSFPPNAWGLYDMNGNVYQWIEDCNQPDVTKLPTDGSAQVEVGCRTRGLKSNSFESHTNSLRSANRSFPYAPTLRGRDYLSIRVAKTLP